MKSTFFSTATSFIAATILCLAGCTGCTGRPAPVDVAPDATAAEEILLKPFDPPSLAELEAKVQWIDQRVVNPEELLRAAQAAEPPLATVPEALALRNDSNEANDKILSAIGRLAVDNSQIDYEATIVRHIAGDVKSTNPLMGSSTSEADVQSLTGVELFGFDWQMDPLALNAAVVSWQTSADGLFDKLVLRDDLTWSDGQPITAHDIVFSFQTIMNPKVPVPAVRSGTDKLRWVHAYDDHTVVYFHPESTPTNVWNINFPVIPKHLYEKSLPDDFTMQDSDYHVQLENKPVTGGPYLMVKREQGQELVFRRRDEYFYRDGKLIRPLQHFREVRFRVIEDPNTALLALKKGDIEESALTAEQWMTQTTSDDFYQQNTRARGTEWVSFHFIWNCKQPFFTDVRVRRAMSHAFDHDEMLNKLFFGLYEPATGPFHTVAWMSPKPAPAPYKQDLAKAEELLDEAGWTDSDGDGIRDKMIDGQLQKFEFTVICNPSPNPIKCCTLLKDNLDRIGIICHVQPLEYTVLQQKELDHNFHAAMGGWGTGTDPDMSVNIFGSKGERNFGQYANAEVDALFEAGRKEFDRTKRAEIYANIHRILYDEQPYTWLFYRNSFYGFNRSLRGYKFSPRGPYSYSPGFSSLWKEAAAP